MFECEICGLLSLGGTACPACGSQILVDLAANDAEDDQQLNEVPGLDEAVASWKELEGIDEDSTVEEAEGIVSNSGSLPFGFSGESNTQVSRLPFGIGSSSQGVPFDQSEDALPLVSRPVAEDITSQKQELVTVEVPSIAPPTATAVEQPTPLEVGTTIHESLPTAESSFSAELPAAEIIPHPPALDLPPPALDLPPPALDLPSPALDLPSPALELSPVRIEAIEVVSSSPTEHVESKEFDEVPSMWKIDASPIDLEQIYSLDEQVVEVVHTHDDANEQFNHTSETSDLHPESSVISLDLHPAKAMGVNLAGLPELETTLSDGFQAIGNESWADAAIAFQKMAAKMPGDTSVFNNYGLALLQRALVMAKSADIDVQQLAATQFQSAILALREAAKSDPTNPVVLLNLAHALLVSGRAEKAQNLLRMYVKSNPASEESVNLEAATYVSLGESGRALELLKTKPQDATIRSNMQKLAGF